MGKTFCLSLAAAFWAAFAFPSSPGAMGSLPTGPSERRDAPDAVRGPDGMIPARVRLLTDGEFTEVLRGEIASAEEEVVLALHRFGLSGEEDGRPEAMARLLEETAARGVSVIVVLEFGREASSVTRSNREAARLLGGMGIPVYADMSGTVTDARLAVIDRKIVFIGSHDMTRESLGRYREASVVISSPVLATSVLSFIETFEAVPYREEGRGD